MSTPVGPEAQAAASGDLHPDASLYARGIAALRIFFGLIFFANGLAKLLDFNSIHIGPYRANLIDRAETRSILDFEVNKRSGGTDIPGLKGLTNDVILPHYDIFQWVITAVEIGVGLALIIGLATRGAALLGLGQQLFLQLVYLSSNRWMFEQPHEWVPLVILAMVPAGIVWGLDGRVRRDRPALRRWPF